LFDLLNVDRRHRLGRAQSWAAARVQRPEPPRCTAAIAPSELAGERRNRSILKVQKNNDGED